MNKVILMGRLTRDPEVRYSQGTDSRGNSTAIARYSLAVDRKFKREGEPDADFFNCTCFGRNAEFAEKYLRKGIKILVTGRIENNNYQGRDGQMVYSVQVMVDEQEFAESKNASGGADNNSNSRPIPPAPAGDGFMSIPDGLDDELPFQ